MTITLTPEQERAVQEAAARRNITPEQLIENALAHDLAAEPTVEDEAQDALRARVKAARGSLAHLGPSTLMQDKAQEKALEERRGQQKE